MDCFVAALLLMNSCSWSLDRHEREADREREERDEVRERYPEGFARWLDGEIGHDGETREAFEERVVGAVERIAAAHSGEHILVVTHGGGIRALRRHAAGDPGESVENAGTVALALVEGELVVHDA